MANQQSGVAQDIDDSPELEVVSNDSASVVEPEEIEALLDEMAKQNDEAANVESIEAVEAEAEPEVTLADPQATIAETEVAAPAELEAVSGETVAAGQTVAPHETGPSFTMEDVLKAASESTSFSVDEIQSFDRDDDLEAVAAEPEIVLLQPDEDDPLQLDSAAPEEVSPKRTSYDREEEGVAKATEESKPKSKSPVAGLDWKSLFNKPTVLWPSIAGIAVLAMFAFMQFRVTGVESRLAKRDKTIERSLSESNELLDNLNNRLASIDRAASPRLKNTSSLGGSHTQVHAPESDSESGMAKEPENDKEIDIHAKPSTDGAKGEKSHAKAPAKKEHSEAPKHVVRPEVRGPNGDHFDEKALVEGMKAPKLLIAKSHAPQHSKSTAGLTHNSARKSKHSIVKPAKHKPITQAGPASNSSIKVYDSTGIPLNRVAVYPSGH